MKMTQNGHFRILKWPFKVIENSLHKIQASVVVGTFRDHYCEAFWTS